MELDLHSFYTSPQHGAYVKVKPHPHPSCILTPGAGVRPLTVIKYSCDKTKLGATLQVLRKETYLRNSINYL